MSENPLILGIETSCDETAVSSQLVSIPNIIGFSDIKFFF